MLQTIRKATLLAKAHNHLNQSRYSKNKKKEEMRQENKKGVFKIKDKNLNKKGFI